MAQYIIDKSITKEHNGDTLYRLVWSYAGGQERVGWTDCTCYISDNAHIMDDAVIYRGAVIHANAAVCGAVIEGAELQARAYVTGNVYVSGGVVSGDIHIGARG